MKENSDNCQTAATNE